MAVMSQLDERPDLEQRVIRLLIVDAHEMVREGIRSILKNEPDMVIVGDAGSAHNLVRLVEQTNPDVVLLDAHLPGVSGAEACRELTQRYPALRVLIVSGYTEEELVRECVAAGAHGYVVKDIDRFELKHAIRAVFRGEGALSSSVAGKILDQLRVGRVRSTPSELNDTQLQILELISRGNRNREIATQMHLSENTVKSHVQEIFRKLDVRNRAEAAMRASQEGWV
jgi:two-component system, NarL family, response regulator DevR